MEERRGAVTAIADDVEAAARCRMSCDKRGGLESKSVVTRRTVVLPACRRQPARRFISNPVPLYSDPSSSARFVNVCCCKVTQGTGQMQTHTKRGKNDTCGVRTQSESEEICSQESGRLRRHWNGF